MTSFGLLQEEVGLYFTREFDLVAAASPPGMVLTDLLLELLTTEWYSFRSSLPTSLSPTTSIVTTLVKV